MAKAWEAFNQGYMSKLKRPEYWNFSPDGAYGASMLSGSQNTNPWANRDQSNAKYGVMGGPQPSKTLSLSPKGAVDMLGTTNLMPKNMNIPGIPSEQKGTFQNLMDMAGGTASKAASNWMTGKVTDWMKGPQSFDKLSPEMQGFADKFMQGGGGDPYDTLMKGFGQEPITESGLGGYDKLFEQSIADSTEELAKPGLFDGISAGDIGTGALAAAPMLGKMFGLKGTAGRALGAAAGIGSAAAQGFMNPISDLMATWNIAKFIGGLF